MARKLIELSITKKITPAERNLLDIIEICTAGAANSRHEFCTKTEFLLDDLSNALGYKEKDKIWSLLKSLYNKKLITREKTRSKNIEKIGLNSEYFGQILINSLHHDEKKRTLKCIVDNSKKGPTECRLDADGPYVVNRRSVGWEPTNRRQSDSQHIDIVNEKSLLDSSRLILDSSRKEASYTRAIGNGEISFEKAEEKEHENAIRIRAMMKEKGFLKGIL